MLPMF